MDLSIIIVNYNVKEFLLNLLDSIYRTKDNLSFEIIVIDNNSVDGSIGAVQTKYPSVITIANKNNLGFGAANNQGLEIAQGDFLLLINPDTLVREDTLVKMVQFLKTNKEIGLAGCKVLNPNGTLQLACRRSFPRPWVSFTKVTGLSSIFPKSNLFAKYNLTYLEENESYEVDAVSGSFMMLSREAYKKVGGFDTDFFMYGEDLDLCYRIQQNGFKVYYYSETEIIHYKGESTKRSQIDETKIFYKAMHQFVKKHFSSSFIIEAILQFGIMLRKAIAFANKNKYILIGLLLDFISFIFLLSLAEKIYSHEKWYGFPAVFKPWVYIIPSIIQLLISALLGSYRRNSLSILRSLSSLFLGLVTITSLTFFFKQYAFSRAVVLITYGLALLVFSLWRIVLKFSFLRKEMIQDTFSKTVIIGTDEKAIQLNNKLSQNPLNTYNIVGLVGNRIDLIGDEVKGKEIIGSIDNLKRVIQDFGIKNVIFSSGSLGFEKMFSSIAQCQGEDVNFLVSGNELDYMVGKSNIAHIDDISLLKVDYNISLPVHVIIKRMFDILISITLFVILFIPYKIFTSISKTKTNNFINFIPFILKGKMSFVGPQKDYDKTDLYLGKQGITGLWFLENIKMKEENENRRLDLFYAKNQNIWLDLEIIGKSLAKYFISGRKNG